MLAPGQRQDFLAWAATFLATYSPFTAHFHILETTELWTIAALEHGVSLGRLGDACAGLILAESLALGDGRLELRDLTPLACASTYSFAAARSLATGIFTGQGDIVTPAWGLAHELTGQPWRRFGVAMLRAPRAALLNLVGEVNTSILSDFGSIPEAVMAACRDIRQSGRIDEDCWNNRGSVARGRGSSDLRVMSYA